MSDELGGPFQPQAPTRLPPEPTLLSGGVVVLAITHELPDGSKMPGLMFRFARPDGSGFYPPMVLLPDDPKALKRLGPLVAAATDHAVTCTRGDGDG